MSMKIMDSRNFYLLWYFSKHDKWKQMMEISYGGHYEMPIEPFCSQYYKDFVWLLDEGFITIEGLSFVGNQFYKEIKPRLLSALDGKLRKILEKNKFGYKDFFLLEEAYKQLIGNGKIPISIIMHSQSLRDYLMDPDSKIKVPDKEKLEGYIQNYSKVTVQESKITVGYEQLSLKDFFTLDLLNSKYKEYCERECGKYVYPTGSKEAIRECLDSEIRTVEDSAIFDFDNISFLLPSMYYLEMLGALEIIEIDENEQGYFDVRYKLTGNIPTTLKDSVYLIECTKKDSANMFEIYINGDRKKPISVKYGERYAKVIYEIANKGFYQSMGAHEKKLVRDYIRYFVEKKLPKNLAGVKITNEHRGKFTASAETEITMKK